MIARSARTLRLFATSPNIQSSKGGLEILGDVLHRLAALPVRAKAPLVLAALVELGLSVLLSPLVMILALLVLIVVGPEAKRHA